MANSQKKVRQPVVAVMGHVDHGKTSFLDAIRGTRVQDKEAGGITQNTRVHEVTLKDGFKITFIDTPGHAAFSNMRERGAKVTDFVVLIVAADDGIQPQTKESIKFAQDNGVPIIVAINKIDISGVKTEKIKKELASFNVVIEEYGGETLCFEISAKTGLNLDKLLEGIELLTEISDLSERPAREKTLGEAFVLESQLDKNLGSIAICILKSGNLSDKVYCVTKEGVFKARAYLNENLKPLNVVGESSPFVLSGLKKEVPAGDIIYFTKTETAAKELEQELIQEVEASAEKLTAESIFAQMLINREEKKQGIEQKVLNIILKSSTVGTLEAIKIQLEKLNAEDAKVNIIASSTGAVREEDIFRAKAAKAIVVSFQLPVDLKLQTIAKQEKVLVRNYEIIYELVDELADVLDSLSSPIEEEVEIARAKVKQVFELTNKSVVAGCEVTKGVMLKGYKVRAERKGVELGKGKISSLRQGKNEVKEVKKGLDCGILIEPQVPDLEEGDELIAFRVERA